MVFLSVIQGRDHQVVPQVNHSTKNLILMAIFTNQYQTE